MLLRAFLFAIVALHLYQALELLQLRIGIVGIYSIRVMLSPYIPNENGDQRDMAMKHILH
jgi:hypothetical protein